MVEQSPITSRLSYAAQLEITDEYLRRLNEIGSELVTRPETRGMLISQARSVLEELTADTDSSVLTSPVAGGNSRLRIAEVGETRAAQGVHPTASIQAAIILFDVALPVVMRELGTGGAGDQSVAVLSSALHQAIMRQIAMAAGPYVGFLMRKLRTSHLAERQRVARELHERAAHAVGLGLRHLELHHFYARSEPERAEAKLVAIEEALREALDSIRSLSAELRRGVGDATLDEVLRAYMRGAVPTPISVDFSVTGMCKVIPAEVAEELYLIIREAIRNALLHAEMTVLQVTITVQQSMITATVHDDGRGFDLRGTLTGRDASGLMSMSERAELLAGRLDVISEPGHGTTVTVRVPFLDGGP